MSTIEEKKEAEDYVTSKWVYDDYEADWISTATETYLAGKAEGQRVALVAIDAEPEMPGDMPNEMWAQIKTLCDMDDREGLAECLRIIVRLTKKGIKKRIIKGKDEQ